MNFTHEYSIEELRQYFLTGLKPTEEQFYRFIKECYNNDAEVIAELKRWTTDELNALLTYIDGRDTYIISLISGITAKMGSDFDATFNVGGIQIGDQIHSGDTVQDVLKNILHQTFSADFNTSPSLEISASTPFDIYEVGTVLNNVAFGTTYTDGSFIDWSGSTTSGVTPSICKSNSYYPNYYIDGTLVSTTNPIYHATITIKTPTTVYDSAITDIYATKLYNNSLAVVHNSDGTVNTSIALPAGICTSEHKQYIGAYMYFGSIIKKGELDDIIDSAHIRALNRFTGFVHPDGVDVIPFNYRYTTKTDGSEYYLIVAVPVGYYVTVDNEASMDVPMRDSGTAVFTVKLGGGTSSSVQPYKLYYTAFNGAAFRNLRINKD